MYRAGVEGILGIRRDGDFLVVNPCIPDSWPGFEATVYVHSTRCEIRVESVPGAREMHGLLDNKAIDCSGEGGVYVPLDSSSHTLLIAVRPGVADGVDAWEPAV
jgi:cyclic beta-1,2-glucan synthetase